MHLYSTLAHTYTLLTPPSEYEQEAAAYQHLLREVTGPGPLALLELGAGAGHNAMWFDDMHLTLTDIAPAMLALAQRNNPAATCLLGDMRTLRLEQRFDAVFAHDALCYLRTPQDLQATFATAWHHLRPGGVALFVPDHVTETFTAGTDCGGSDNADGSEGVRYLEWSWQRPGQSDGYVVDYTIMHRVGEAAPEVHYDRHEEGLFPRATWVRLLEATGFQVERYTLPELEIPDLFRAARPA